MKYGKIHAAAVILIFCLFAIRAGAQFYSEKIKEFIANEENLTRAGITNLSFIKEFYNKLGYKFAWFGEPDNVNKNDLSAILKQSAALGLEESDYRTGYIDSCRQGTVLLNSTNDSLLAEIRFTDAAIHFLQDLVYGNSQPVLGYKGPGYSSACLDITGLLASHVSSHTLQPLVEQLNQGLPEIIFLEKKLAQMQTVIAEPNFSETIITSPSVNSNNKPLVSKLHHLGILDSDSMHLPDSLLKKKVREAQRQFNLPDDGTLRKTIIDELNMPISIRLRGLKLSLNYYRWLNCFTRDQSVIVVNIPASYLKVYHNNEVILEMRMIVGKRSTPTPTLASRINEVILYPYWNVPYKIATKELLPSIKKDPGFITAGNFQVLNKSGKIVDPYSVNWQELSVKNFPYTIRQSTGCDNALGLLKLDFYSPYDVYLHDTPTKGLFILNKRYFSHGCMRMEKPFELGHLVLKNNQMAIDTLTEKGCLRNQAPITVPADEHMPVIVWYNPAGIDSSGRVIFYEDVYRKLDWMKRKVN